MTRLRDHLSISRRSTLRLAAGSVAAGVTPSHLLGASASDQADFRAATDRPAAQDPVAILGPKLVAWFDDTDPRTLFQDPAGTTPIVEGGTAPERTVALQRAKTPGFPAGDPGIVRVQADPARRPAWAPRAYDAGRPGLAFDGIDDGMISRTVAFSGGNGPYAAIVAAQFLGTDSFGPLVSAFHEGWTNGENWGTGEQRALLFRVNDRVASVTDVESSIAGSGLGAGGLGRWAVEYDGAEIAGYANGVRRFARRAARPIGERIQVAFWSALGGGWQDPASSGYAVRGVEQHAILAKAALTEAERAALDAYLAGTQGDGIRTVPLDATSTRGSMRAGSNVVTVQDATGFVVGQQILVEPSTGYGTVGPGGVWPDAALDSESAILSATTSTPNSHVRALDTGRTYQAKADGTGYYPWDVNLFYTNRAIPRPLVAAIVAVSGRELTLSAPSRADVSEAVVAVDNHPVLAGLTGGDGATFRLPAGTFALSRGVSYAGKRDWTIAGAGRSETVLRHLRGSTPTFIHFWESISPTVSDLTIVGSHGWDGSQGIEYTPDGNGSNGYGSGISFARCSNPLALNIAWQDVNVSAIAFADARDAGRPFMRDGMPFASEDGVTRNAYMAVDCHGGMTLAQQRYVNWQYSVVDTTGGGEFRDCTFDSDWMTSVYESFRSTGCRFVRPVSRNGLLACNSAAGTTIDRPVFTFTAHCRDRSVVNPIANQALFNLNGNIRSSSSQGAGSGGRIVNPTITVEGWHDSGGSVMKAISMSDQPGWIVEGTYDPTKRDDGARLGLIRAPAPKAGVLASRPRIGTLEYACISGPSIVSDSSDTIVTGLMLQVLVVDGMDRWPQFPASINLYATDNTRSAVLNTITGSGAPSISAPRARSSGNVSSRQYASMDEAVGPGDTRSASPITERLGGPVSR